MTRRMIRPLAVVAVMGATLGGCGFFDDEEKLEGERVRIRDTRTEATARAPAAPLPAPQSNRDWTQTNGRADHASGHLAGPASARLAWRADAGAGGPLTGAPIVVGGRVLTLDGEATVSSFDAGSGGLGWRTDLTPEGEDGEEGFGGGLAADGNLIFATTGFGEVVALNAASGEVAWRYKAAAPFRSAPAVQGGTVVAVTRDNEAVALDQASGRLVWRVGGVTSQAGLLGGASPAIAGDLVVVPYGSGEIAGVQRSTGRQVWSTVLGGSRRGLARGSIADVTGDPVIAGRAVIAANQSGRMVAVDGQTGQRGWTRSIGATGPLWVAGDSVFVVSDAARLLRLSLASGATIWEVELPAYEDPEDREDAIAYSGPVLAGGRIWLTDGLGSLWNFDAATGAPGDRTSLSDGATAGIAVAGGTLYVLSDDGTLQAFR